MATLRICRPAYVLFALRKISMTKVLTIHGEVFIFCLLALSTSGEQPTTLPNIVVYLADDLSADDLSIYGGTSIVTPSIDRLAAEGKTFDRAFVASPSCAPSRAALLTGLMPARNGAEENHSYPRKSVLRLPRLLNNLGYETAAFGKVAHNKSANDYGFETIRSEKSLPQLRQNVQDYLEHRTDPRPLALFVGTSNPHVPWPSTSTIDPLAVRLPRKLLDTPRTRVQRSRYLQEVVDLDTYLGELRDLTQKHLGGNTVFAFSSDHGAQFPFSKWTLYDEGIRVPLVIAWPGSIIPSSRTRAMVSWVDLLPTLISLAGGKTPDEVDGRSFAEVLTGAAQSHREQIFTTHSGDRKMNVYLSRSIRTKRFKLIYNPHPEYAFTTHIDLLVRETSGDYFKEWQALAKTNPAASTMVARFHGRPAYELYDLRDDPDEQTNLAYRREYRDLRKTLTSQLDRWLEEQGDKLTVFHEPLYLDNPSSWLPRK